MTSVKSPNSCSKDDARTRIQSPRAGKAVRDGTHTLVPQGETLRMRPDRRKEPEDRYKQTVRFPNGPTDPMDSTLRDSESIGPRWGLETCIHKKFSSGFDDQPSLGMVGLIFMVSSCLLSEVTYVQK